MRILSRSIVPLVVIMIGLIATFIGLQIGGSPINVPDEEPLIRNLLPMAKMLMHLGAAGLLGGLVLALWAIPRKSPAYGRALDIAGISAIGYTVAGAAVLLCTFVDVTGVGVSATPSFGSKLWQYMSSVELGRLQSLPIVGGVVLSVACLVVRHRVGVLFVTGFAVLALSPLAQQGHAAGQSNHSLAVTTLTVHLIGAAGWLGGLSVLALSARLLADPAAVLRRYSTIALIAFVAVAASGLVSAAIRLDGWQDLSRPYGLLLILKFTCLVILGALGAWQRLRLIRRFEGKVQGLLVAPPAGGVASGGVSVVRDGGSAPRLGWFVVVELAVMALASGFAAALAATPNPRVLPSGTPSPAELLTGDPLPPAPELWRFLTEWRFDFLWAMVVLFGVFFYLAGVWRLRRRGDSWPWYRTVFWVCGMLLLAWTTSGGVNLYGVYLFSAHMAAHMILTMAVPVLLVPGAPITLALRAICARRDGTTGSREWILLAINSWPAKILTRPIVAAGMFVVSLWVFYFSPLFRWATVDHLGHIWMTLHFLVTGYLFVQSLVGVDPVHRRPSYPLRLLLLLATMAFHAFFGLAIMSSTGLLLSDWYGAMGWGADALLDQQLGGGIAWSVGEIPTLALAIAVAVQWARSDEREARRRDRFTDRVGDQELAAYNERFARASAAD